MASFVKRNTEDLVYEAVDANLAGGLMVVPSTTATESGLQGIKAAGDAAKNALGISAKDCVTAANRDALSEGTGAAPLSAPFVDNSVPSATTTVYNMAVGLLTYTAAAVAYGAKLACAANGAVRAWVAADGADAMIGWCAQPGGVSAAGGPGLARILL